MSKIQKPASWRLKHSWEATVIPWTWKMTSQFIFGLAKRRSASLDPDLTHTPFPSFLISSLKDNLEGLGDQKKFTHYDDFLSVGQGARVKKSFYRRLSDRE